MKDFQSFRLSRLLCALVAGVAVLLCSRADAGMADADFHQVQTVLNSSMLDAYEGGISPETSQELGNTWQALSGDVTDPAGKALMARSLPSSPVVDMAAEIGARRSVIQHVAALEMLQSQKAGDVDQTRVWRDLITLPQFANADDGGLLLQQSADQVRQPGVTQALAKEYVGWQVARTRQLLDRFQHSVVKGDADETFVRANLAEIQALSQFPPALLQAAGINTALAPASALPVLEAPYDSPGSVAKLAQWRDRIEATLPNLLSASDVSRLERLLARLIEIIPKEYRNAGVQDGKMLIRLEYQEAQQFTQEAQGLVNELSPVWNRDQHEAFTKYHAELVQKLGGLAKTIDQVGPLSDVESGAKEVQNILEGRFGLSARRTGDRSQIVDDTALEVRSSLNNSLAAAQAGHWQEAENLRLDAYTSFDSEIEVRVLPRNPELAMRTERSFLDGGSDSPGIKALLDRQTSMDELSAGYERALKNMDQCVAVLKVAVSPTTVGFTAFTIIAREGMEAIIILTALLAGLRGDENRQIRRWITGGALFGVFLSLVTFWLSQTLVQSLVRYGEKLEAVVSILAVIILFMVTNWVFHKFYWVEWNARLRSLSKNAQQVRAPVWEVFALLGVGFLTVYREGFETTVFMQSLLLEGGHAPVILGVGAGLVFIGTVGTLIFLFGVKLPFRKLLVVTGVLVVSIMVTFMGSTVRLFQTVGWLPVHPIPWLPIPSWMGLWLGIYPSWEGILIPPLALVYVGGAWLWVRMSSRGAQQSSDRNNKNLMTKTGTLVTLTATLLMAAIFKAQATPYQFDSAAAGAGGAAQVAPQKMPDGLTTPISESIWTQDTLTGDWWGVRNRIMDHGLTLSANLQAEVFGNPVGGMSQGAISDGAFNLVAALDLEQLTNGFWKGGLIQANALYIYGQGLSEKYVGDFSNTSNIQGPQSIRLQELWYQETFWLQRASIRVGMLAADTEFFTSASSALFLNGTFGAFDLIGQNFPGAPVYPLSRPGVRFYVAPTSNFYVRAAIFGMDSNLNPGGNDLYGTDFKINSNDGLLWMFETGFLLNQGPDAAGLQGTYKVGTFFEPGNFTTWHSQAQAALGTGGLSGRSTEYAIYGVADQQVYQKEDTAISLFVRGGFAPAQTSVIDGYLDAGVNFTGFIPTRPNDIAGVAIAYANVSRDYSDAQVLQGGAPMTYEIPIEFTYQVHVTPWCNIQPDVQYILNPSGASGSHNALVLGMRTSINF